MGVSAASWEVWRFPEAARSRRGETAELQWPGCSTDPPQASTELCDQRDAAAAQVNTQFCFLFLWFLFFYLKEALQCLFGEAKPVRESAQVVLFGNLNGFSAWFLRLTFCSFMYRPQDGHHTVSYSCLDALGLFLVGLHCERSCTMVKWWILFFFFREMTCFDFRIWFIGVRLHL